MTERNATNNPPTVTVTTATGADHNESPASGHHSFKSFSSAATAKAVTRNVQAVCTWHAGITSMYPVVASACMFVVTCSMTASRRRKATAVTTANVDNTMSYVSADVQRRLRRSDRRNAHTSRHATVAAVSEQVAITVNTYVTQSTATELVGTVHTIACVQNRRNILLFWLFRSNAITAVRLFLINNVARPRQTNNLRIAIKYRCRVFKN